jgi:hypothetical protein
LYEQIALIALKQSATICQTKVKNPKIRKNEDINPVSHGSARMRRHQLIRRKSRQGSRESAIQRCVLSEGREVVRRAL